MYAMRGLGSKESVQGHMNKLVTRGLLIKTEANAEMLLRVLNQHGIATLAEAALRFARHELKADVVLTGTGSMRHLESNILACEAGPLPEIITLKNKIFK